MTNSGLKIFNDNLELHNTKINGVFDGEQVYLDGKGKIDNFDSDLIYRYNFTDQSEYQQLLKIKTAVKTQNQKVGLIKVLPGLSLLNFEYKVKDEKTHISANANL